MVSLRRLHCSVLSGVGLCGHNRRAQGGAGAPLPGPAAVDLDDHGPAGRPVALGAYLGKHAADSDRLCGGRRRSRAPWPPDGAQPVYQCGGQAGVRSVQTNASHCLDFHFHSLVRYRRDLQGIHHRDRHLCTLSAQFLQRRQTHRTAALRRGPRAGGQSPG